MTTPSRMEPRDASRAVAHLQGLYTVVVGIGLTLAITGLIKPEVAVPINVRALPYVASYLLVLVPFYHGALRHLDDAFIALDGSEPKPGALMADWSFLFLESCALVGLALLVERPAVFAFSLLGLLAFDALWAFAAHLAFSRRATVLTAEQKWSIINCVSVIFLIIALVFLDSLPAGKPIETYRWILVLSLSVGRTIWDYSWCWDFYYPQARP